MKYKSPNNDRWVLPSAYYTKRLQLGGDNYATFVFLDTSPCQKIYRSDDSSGWDPCGPDFPSPSDCAFHANILKQNCTLQKQWLKSAVSAIPKDDWVIGVGHAPAYEIDVE